MSKSFYLILALITIHINEMHPQLMHFSIAQAVFSTNTTDEFSPVFYNNGLVICSNLAENSLISYKNGNNGLFKLFFIEKKDSSKWKQPKLLARELTTNFNDGPATFNELGNIIYYSRNNLIENSLKNSTNPSNKVGIYSSELINGKWTNIKPFTYNNPLYSLGTPALAPNSERIYFSSDMPGGFGGMDLYYCNKINNSWSLPINLGSEINTSKNESFPFVSKSGLLFFASDGLKGFGGKDIFYTQQISGNWILPIHLDSTINSAYDDFGLTTDSLFERGYFSSNRNNSDDIFSFSVVKDDFPESENMIENSYCFTLYDEQYQPVDKTPVIYKWDFGNGIIREGAEVQHCFPGPGNYKVKLSIIDPLTDKTILKQYDYPVELENIEQPFITSYSIGIVGNSMTFDGTKSVVSGGSIIEYFWNFGDGYRPGKQITSNTFNTKGDYTVYLGLIAKQDSLGNLVKKSVMKKIRIYDSFEELVLNGTRKDTLENKAIKTESDTKLQTRFYLMDDLSKPQKLTINESLIPSGNMVVEFNKEGIASGSYPFLDKIANILKKDHSIQLYMAIHNIKNEVSEVKSEVSEQWAQELAFFLKNKEIPKEAYESRGFGRSPSGLKSERIEDQTIDGFVEFIFANKR